METDKLIEALRDESRYKDKATLEIMDLCMMAADKLEELNNFEQTQCAKLLVRLQEKDKQLAAAEALRASLPDNDVLTLDELQEMDGEPVWCGSTQNTLPYKGWYLFDARPEFGGKPLVNCNHAIRADEISRGLWLAYRRPPERGGTDNGMCPLRVLQGP